MSKPTFERLQQLAAIGGNRHIACALAAYGRTAQAEAAKAMLLKMVQSESNSTAMAALIALRQFELVEEDAGPIEAVATGESDIEVRRAAIETLALADIGSICNRVLKFAETQGNTARTLAVDYLFLAVGEDALPCLEKLASATTPKWQAKVARQLGHIGGQKVLELLRKLKGGDDNTRATLALTVEFLETNPGGNSDILAQAQALKD